MIIPLSNLPENSMQLLAAGNMLHPKLHLPLQYRRILHKESMKMSKNACV